MVIDYNNLYKSLNWFTALFALMLATSLLARLFECFGDEGIKYKQRVRSRVSNLGDLKNPGLRQNVIAGHISPAKIAVMTPEVRRWIMLEEEGGW